jgi:hypothetical protein
MSAGGGAALGHALLARGIRASVEARGSLAVLLPLSDPDAFADAAVRDQVLALAREHGFTHVAVELLGAPRVSGTNVP